jgi:hypothetical protein
MYLIQRVKRMSEELVAVKPGKFMVASPWASEFHLQYIARADPARQPLMVATKPRFQFPYPRQFGRGSVQRGTRQEKFDALPEAHSYRFRGS